MITKILKPSGSGKVVYDNKGSCARLVNYLAHEARPKGKEVAYFNGSRDDITPAEVTAGIDGNRKGLRKEDAKFYSLVISPSADELKHIGNDAEKLKTYTRQVMENYARNFQLKDGRKLEGKDLVWYATFHQGREYNGFDQQVREGAVKAGVAKPGLQTQKLIPLSDHCPRGGGVGVYKDYHKLLDKLKQDYQCASMIRSIITAVDMEASNQTAGMVSTLQLGLGRINTPEICYVLSGDEFSLDINDTAAPKMLCIGTSPTLSDTFAPVISCLVTVAIKLMNSQGKHHSYVLLDEGPTLYLPKFDQLPTTARSNKVATIYMAQDFSQMKKEYGQNEAEAITSNLNNQFFGRVANLHTAEYVSRIFGKEDRLMRSEGLSNNQPNSLSLGLDGRTSAGSRGNSVNYSLQERNRIYPQELLNLEVGQFFGTTVETASPNFSVHFAGTDFPGGKVAPFAEGVDVENNYKRIILEVEAILEGKILPVSTVSA